MNTFFITLGICSIYLILICYIVYAESQNKFFVSFGGIAILLFYCCFIWNTYDFIFVISLR